MSPLLTAIIIAFIALFVLTMVGLTSGACIVAYGFAKRLIDAEDTLNDMYAMLQENVGHIRYVHVKVKALAETPVMLDTPEVRDFVGSVQYTQNVLEQMIEQFDEFVSEDEQNDMLLE